MCTRARQEVCLVRHSTEQVAPPASYCCVPISENTGMLGGAPIAITATHTHECTLCTKMPVPCVCALSMHCALRFPPQALADKHAEQMKNLEQQNTDDYNRSLQQWDNELT